MNTFKELDLFDNRDRDTRKRCDIRLSNQALFCIAMRNELLLMPLICDILDIPDAKLVSTINSEDGSLSFTVYDTVGDSYIDIMMRVVNHPSILDAAVRWPLQSKGHLERRESYLIYFCCESAFPGPGSYYWIQGAYNFYNISGSKTDFNNSESTIFINYDSPSLIALQAPYLTAVCEQMTAKSLNHNEVPLEYHAHILSLTSLDRLNEEEKNAVLTKEAEQAIWEKAEKTWREVGKQEGIEEGTANTAALFTKIIRCYRKGLSPSEIGQAVGLSEATILDILDE